MFIFKILKLLPCSYSNVSIRCHDAYLKLKLFGVVFICGRGLFKGYFWYENVIFLRRDIQSQGKVRSFRTKQHCSYWKKKYVYIYFIISCSEIYTLLDICVIILLPYFYYLLIFLFLFGTRPIRRRSLFKNLIEKCSA